MTRWLPVLLLLCVASLGAGNLTQDLENADDLSVGDRFQFNIRGDFAINRVIVPDTLTNFTVLAVERQTDQGVNPWFRLTIAPILPGYHTFPALKVEPVRDDGKDYWTDRFRINVVPVRAEADTALVDIKPLEKYALQFPPLLYLGLFIGALALLVGIILLRPSKRSPSQEKAPEPIAPQTPKQAWEEALDQLHALLEQGLVQRGEIVQHHYWLSMILRNFLERRYRFAAREMTQSEIRMALSRLMIGPASQIMEFLQYSDRAKFGKYIPQAQELDDMHTWLESFLRRTGMEDSIQAATNVTPDGTAVR
jgi:hypothetical protein